MPKAPPKVSSKQASKSQSSRSKNPKDSHLYTDDNPATTIHGTGFKDKAAALRTLGLIKDRSLTYQFQTVNTMYHRAKHHPSMKAKTEGSAGISDMKQAMDVFRHWLDATYPEQRAAMRASGFKPLLSKDCVQKYMSQIDDSADVSDSSKKFAEKYVELPKGKRLGNVLVNDSKPTEADWERVRYDSLDELVPEGKEAGSTLWKREELWTNSGGPSALHLRLIAWAWSPVKESRLL